MCAVSMGLVVEVYQLRNEVFSSFLVMAAGLLAIHELVMARGSCSGQRSAGLPVRLRAVLAGWGCLALAFLGLFAKVQALPVLIGFVVFAPLLGARMLGLLWLKGFLVLLGVLFSCISLMALGLSRVAGLNVDPLQLFIVTAALCGPSAMAFSGRYCFDRYIVSNRFTWIFGAVVGSVAVAGYFLNLALKFGWLALVVNPLSIRTYAVSAQACEAGRLRCLVEGGLKGFSYLVERSVDGYALVVAVGLIVVIAWLVMLCHSVHAIGRAVAGRTSYYALTACLVIGAAFGMALLAGQRWAVDHYLPYQQPYFFLGLLMLARGTRPWHGLWVALSAVVIVSVVLIFIRYPDSARATYVKQGVELESFRSAGDGSLCAAQHAGVEWRHSSIWRLCDGFSHSIPPHL
jgi:hypothetical protein